MTVSVLFTARPGVVPWVIREATRSKVSHCAIAVPAGARTQLVIEAGLFGVQATPRQRWIRKASLVAEYEVPDLAAPTLDAALEALGEPYGYADLWHFPAVLISRWLRLKMQHPRRRPHSVVCSGLVVRLLAAHGAPWANLDPHEADPEDVRAACEALGWRKVA